FATVAVKRDFLNRRGREELAKVTKACALSTSRVMSKASVYNLAAEDRALAAWEIVSVVASVLIGEWVVFALAGDGALGLLFPVATVFAFMFLSHRACG